MEGETPKRRGRPLKDPSERKSSSLKMRTRANLREMLEAAASVTGRSCSEEAEYRLLASFASEKPTLTAEDVRQIVREEMGQRPSSGAQAYGFFGGHLLELGKKLTDAPAWHVGPPVPPCFPDGGHVHIASDQGEGPRRAVGRDDCEACRIGYGATYPCGRSDCPHAGYRHF